MVALRVLAQLMMEGNKAEATRVTELFSVVGLPLHLEHLGMAVAQRHGSGAYDSLHLK